MKAFLPLVLVLSGCSTGVVQTGPNTYMIAGSKPGLIGSGSVKAGLYREAGEWCSERGLAMVPMQSSGQDAVYGRNAANAEIHFRAVPPAEASRYPSNVERQADRVMEVRER